MTNSTMNCVQSKDSASSHAIIALYFESENELKFYNLEAWTSIQSDKLMPDACLWLAPPLLNKVCELILPSSLFGQNLLILL